MIDVFPEYDQKEIEQTVEAVLKLLVGKPFWVADGILDITKRELTLRSTLPPTNPLSDDKQNRGETNED